MNISNEVQIFINDVLDDMFTNVDHDLPEIKHYLFEEEDRDEYFDQHLLFIREEIKATVNQEKEMILSNKKDPFLITPPPQKQKGKTSKKLIQKNFLVKKNNLPKLDTGF